MGFGFISKFIEGRKAWARRSSLWPLTFGIMCCALEMMAAGTGRFDTERFGMIYRPSPRHSDILIINGQFLINSLPDYVYYGIKCLNQNGLCVWENVLHLVVNIINHIQ